MVVGVGLRELLTWYDVPTVETDTAVFVATAIVLTDVLVPSVLVTYAVFVAVAELKVWYCVAVAEDDV